MKLPALVYGFTPEVKKRVSRMITKLKRGASLAEAIGDDMLDTADTPGLIVLNGGSPLLGSEPHFHLYMPIHKIREAMLADKPRLPPEEMSAYFHEFLKHAWSTLALQGHNSFLWVAKVETYQPFIQATLKWWPEFDDEPRYTHGTNQGLWLWQCHPTIGGVMINSGVPKQALIDSFLRTREDIEAMLDKYHVPYTDEQLAIDDPKRPVPRSLYDLMR
ncbi:MAG: hypothetical protein Tsb0020_13360 [Haliangiales bacterium]